MNTTKMSRAEIHKLVLACFKKHGCSEEVAEAVTRVVVKAEADGCSSHGLFRVPGYIASLLSGKVDGRAIPETAQIAPSVTRVDGKGGFAPPALDNGAEALIDLAGRNGIAALSLVNIHHFSALWVDLEKVCEVGLVGMAFTSFLPAIAPAGGTKPLFGTNPMAFGWPRNSKRPMIFDQASSVVAKGEVMIAARDGKELPKGVGIDAAGNPTTNPQKVLEGALLAFGGYKGAAIALMVELLAGSLIGEQFSYEAAENDNGDGGPPRGGELLIAMHPELLGGRGALDHAEKIFAKFCPENGTRLPADRRYLNRDSFERDGIPVAQDALDKINALMA